MPQDGSTSDNRPTVNDLSLFQSQADVGGGGMSEDVPREIASTDMLGETVSAPQGSAVAIASSQDLPERSPSDCSSLAVDNPTQFAEASAENLMQEVFGDVDRMLQTGAAPPPDLAAQDGVKLRSLPLSDLNSDLNFEAGGSLAPRSESAALHADRLDQAHHSQSEMTPDASSNAASKMGDRSSSASDTAQPKLTSLLLRLALMVSASIALGVGMAVWMAQRSQSQVATQPAASSTAPVNADSAEADFINYMSESLDAIDNRYEQIERLSSATVDDDADGQAATADTLPPLPERVYIPVYQPPQATAALPTLPAPSLNSAASTTPATPSASTPAESGNTAANVPNIAPDTRHALVGLLELGDRSAAIFEYGGTARRVEVGEQIGSSGWSLVSVSAQEAIIRRNGDVRSIYIGQSF